MTLTKTLIQKCNEGNLEKATQRLDEEIGKWSKEHARDTNIIDIKLGVACHSATLIIITAMICYTVPR